MVDSNKIGHILRDMGVLTSADITRTLLEQQRSQRQFGQILLDWKLATADQVCEAWARQLTSQQRHVDLDEFEIDPQAIRKLTGQQAWKLRALPLRCWGDHLVVAVVTLPLDGKILEDLAQATGHPYVHLCYCSPDQLNRYLNKLYPLDTPTPV